MNEILFIALLVVALYFLLRLPITLANHFSRNDPKPEEEPNKGYGYISNELKSDEMLLSKDEFDNIVKLHFRIDQNFYSDSFYDVIINFTVDSGRCYLSLSVLSDDISSCLFSYDRRYDSKTVVNVDDVIKWVDGLGLERPEPKVIKSRFDAFMENLRES